MAIMSERDCVVAAFQTHPDAEQAIKEPARAGIDMHTMSIVAKDLHTDASP
jgi:hypothetical protein